MSEERGAKGEGEPSDDARADLEARLAAVEAELADAQARLLRSEKLASLGMLVAGIAHEINTPIGAVRSMHETMVRAIDKLRAALEKELPDYASRPKLASLLAIIEDSNRVVAEGSQRVIEIVRRVRSFARLDEAELRDVDIHACLEDTLTLVHHELKHHVTVTRAYGEVPPLACYPGRLNQVFLNLLMNARQAIAKNGEIRIETGVETGRARVTITDTGSGIAPENLSRLFQPGFTTKGAGVGTGLGLSIVASIVEEHRGTVDVRSAPGQGTTFTLFIPLDLRERLLPNEDEEALVPTEATEPADSSE